MGIAALSTIAEELVFIPLDSPRYRLACYQSLPVGSVCRQLIAKATRYTIDVKLDAPALFRQQPRADHASHVALFFVHVLGGLCGGLQENG